MRGGTFLRVVAFLRGVGGEEGEGGGTGGFRGGRLRLGAFFVGNFLTAPLRGGLEGCFVEEEAVPLG